jgi:hypothetical protein
MLATQRANSTIGTIINQRNHARAVTQKGSPPRDRVQNTVQAQPRRHAGGILLQPLAEPPRASYGEGGEVADARAVAEVVGPAAAGEGGVVDRRAVLEGEVVEGVLVEAGEGV